MTLFRFRRRLSRTVPAAALLTLLTTDLQAQISRAQGSTNARTGTQRATTATSRTSTTASTGPRQYRSNTMLGDAHIEIDPETRSLVITADEETQAQIAKVIKELDRPKPQVLIKVVFLEVTYNKDLDVGLEGSYSINLGGNGLGPPTGTNTTTDTTTKATGAATTRNLTSTLTSTAALIPQIGTAQTLFGLASQTDGSFVRLVGDNWQATLRALAHRGKLEVLSRPSILARNNQEAVIVVGSEVPFITNSRIDQLGQTVNTIQYDNVGIILRVTPFITSQGMVEMIVAPEISTLTDQTVPISNTVSAPVIAKRSAETVVDTPDATTVVIGGLMETQHTEAIQKVPILGDIPGLGLAFKRTIKSDVKRELLIFLTPYIVRTAEGLKDLTLDEANRSELAAKSFTPDEIAKHIDTLVLEPKSRRAVPVSATFLVPAPELRTEK